MTLLEQVVSDSRKLRPKSRLAYLGYIRQYVEFAGPYQSNWTGYTLERWRDQLLSNGIEPKTVVLYMSAVAYGSKRLANLGRGADFAKGAERPSYENKESATIPLTLAQIRRLLGTCGGDYPMDVRDRTMILIGLRAAFRREELVTVAFEETINHEITVIAKGGRRHTVKVADEAWDQLGKWTRWLRKQGITSGRVFRNLRPSIEGPGTWHIGKALSGDGFSKILAKRAEAAGIEHLHPHRLRHTYASLAIASGVPPWRVQMVLGHKFKVGDREMIDQLSSMTGHYVKDVNETSVDASFPSLLPDSD